VELLVASKNPGKLRELRGLFQPLGIKLIEPASLGLAISISEGEDSYRQNAAKKALGYAQIAKLWTLGDDSGLEVDALGGRPGLLSARLAGPGKTDSDRRAVLIDLLAPHSRPWLARFRCTLALASPKGDLDFTEGVCEGEIIPTERGSYGFGYDPIFLIAGRDQTLGELTREEKNGLSHRAKAVMNMIPMIKERIGVGD
jgi:XTP/dITP diphosphohydrolase